MTAEGFVAKYGITGGAVRMSDRPRRGQLRRGYEFHLTVSNPTRTYCAWWNCLGEGAHLFTALRPTELLLVLNHYRGVIDLFDLPKGLTFPRHSGWSAEEDELLQRWMGPSMFEDFKTVTSLS